MTTIPYYLKKTDGAYLLLTTGARLILDYTDINDDELTHISELDTTTNILELEQPDLAELDTTTNIVEQETVDVEELETDNITEWQP